MFFVIDGMSFIGLRLIEVMCLGILIRVRLMVFGGSWVFVSVGRRRKRVV